MPEVADFGQDIRKAEKTKPNTTIVLRRFVMKVRIKDICTACGLCLDICPDVFGMGWAVAEAAVDEIPLKFEEAVRQAVDECPVEAIIVE